MAPPSSARAEKAMERLEEFNPQNLANTAWAFAMLDLPHDVLLRAIAGRAMESLEAPQEGAWNAAGAESARDCGCACRLCVAGG